MKKRILVLGASGMIGHTIFNELSKNENYDVYGTIRKFDNWVNKFPQKNLEKIRPNVDAENFDTIMRALASIQPDIVINCIGLIKQIPLAKDPLTIITLNAQLPHRISMVCRTANARLIHLSTDCVFEGTKGNYTEEDNPDAKDIYGRTKYLGEVFYPHCVTIRTSTIGPELKGGFGLLEWFLVQKDEIKGFTKAIFSGFPTVELASIIDNFIIPNESLSGLYHIASKPISKYSLLKLIAEEYEKEIKIIPDDSFFCDRSLDSSNFNNIVKYKANDWKSLITRMHALHNFSKK
jgi:dTDP-4-dehydrorhamnose reductase